MSTFDSPNPRSRPRRRLAAWLAFGAVGLATGAVWATGFTSFTGTQGEKNWYYGYYNKTADADGIYQATNFTLFPRNPGAFSATNYWTGTIWNWLNFCPLRIGPAR